MTQQEAIYRDVVAEVQSATQAVRKIGGEDRNIWNLKLNVSAISNFPLTTSMAMECAQSVMQGEGANARLMRGRIQADREGNVIKSRDGTPFDGSRDYHYYWEVAYWNGVANPMLGPAPSQPPAQARSAAGGPPPQQQQAPPTQAPPPQQQSAGFKSKDDFRTKEELRWTEAWKMAVRLAAVPHFGISGMADLELHARTFYGHLDATPAPYCAEHDTEYTETSPKTGKKYHIHNHTDGSQSACIHGGGLVPMPAKQQPAPTPPPPAPEPPVEDREVDDLPW